MQVEIATQRSAYFTKNLIAIRAEKRAASWCTDLFVKRSCPLEHSALPHSRGRTARCVL